MRSLEQTICECTRKAEANRELAKYNKSHVDRANDLKNAEECEQLAEWLRILKKAKFEYDEAWRIITHPTPDVTYVDKNRAQVILDTFKDSLGRMEC